MKIIESFQDLLSCGPWCRARVHRFFPYFIRCFSVLCFYIAGVSYYSTVEGWTIADCIFFITESVATIGYGQLHPTTDGSRVFTCFFVIIGLIFVLSASDEFAKSFVVGFQDFLLLSCNPRSSPLELAMKRLSLSLLTLVLIAVLGVSVFSITEEWSGASAFYWTITTMTTVGYGDLDIKNHETRVFSIFFILFCVVEYATMIHNLQSVHSLMTLSRPHNSDLELTTFGTDDERDHTGLLHLHPLPPPHNSHPRATEKGPQPRGDAGVILLKTLLKLLETDPEVAQGVRGKISVLIEEWEESSSIFITKQQLHTAISNTFDQFIRDTPRDTLSIAQSSNPTKHSPHTPPKPNEGALNPVHTSLTRSLSLGPGATPGSIPSGLGKRDPSSVSLSPRKEGSAVEGPPAGSKSLDHAGSSGLM